jgi:hypothetical protein
MGLFGPKLTKDEKAKAKAIATRGVAARARVDAMTETGETRDEVAREIEFRLVFTPNGGSEIDVTTRQFMNDLTLTGLAPGEPASISYDSSNPTTVLVHGSPKYRVIQSQGALVAIPVVDQG